MRGLPLAFRTLLVCISLVSLLWQQVIPAFAQTTHHHPEGTANGRTSKAIAPVRMELPNGLKIVVIETPAYPVVSCMMWYHTATEGETNGKTGVAHLLEHLLFVNVGSFKKYDLASSIVRNGGQFNGYTSDDFMTFFETLPSSKLELALKIEAERMRGANFSEADVPNALAEINSELDEQVKDPLESLSKEVRALSFVRHRYRNPTIGWKCDIDTLKAKDAREFYNRYFWPNNATLIVAGDIKQDGTIQLIKKYFGGIERSPQPIADAKILEPNQRAERTVTMNLPGRQETLQVAYHAPAVDDDDAPAFVVLEQLLNSPYTGRLKTRLMQSKLCTSAVSSFEARKDPGLFTITCQAAANDTLAKILIAVDTITTQLKTQPVSDADLRRARRMAEFAYQNECDGPYKLAFHVGFFDALSSQQSNQDWADRLRSVNANDLQRIAKLYFVPENRTVGYLENPNPAKPTTNKGGQAEVPKPDNKPEIKPPNSRQLDHVHLTGFKINDLALKPLRALRGAPADQTAAAEPQSSVQPNAPAAAPAEKPPSRYSLKRSPSKSTHSKTPKEPTPATVYPADSDIQVELQPPPEPVKEKAPTVNDSWTQCLKTRTLKNGLRIAVLESHISPIVEIHGLVRAGEVFDPTNKKGLAALTAEGLNCGSLKHTQQQLRQIQEDFGLSPQAMLNFDCQKETINFDTTCFASNLADHLGLIAESILTPAFPEMEIEKAKQDLVADVKQSESSLESRIERTALRNLIAQNSQFYPEDPLALVHNIPMLKTLDVRTYHKEHIVPNETVVVFVGDTNIDEVSALMEKAFGTWTAVKPTLKPLVRPSSRRVLRTSIPITDKDDARLCLAKLLEFSEGNRDYPYLLLADCNLASHPLVSRMALALSKDERLMRSLKSGAPESKLESLANATSWSLSISAPPTAAAQLVTTVKTEIDNFSKGIVSPMELSECKRYLLGSIPVGTLSTRGGFASTIGQSMVQDCEPSFASRLLGTIRTSNLDILGKFIRNNFKPNQATLIITGPSESIKAVSKSCQ